MVRLWRAHIVVFNIDPSWRLLQSAGLVDELREAYTASDPLYFPFSLQGTCELLLRKKEVEKSTSLQHRGQGKRRVLLIR